MKKTNWILGILLLVMGCGQKFGNYYFDFDAIEYYTIEIDENKLLKTEENPNLTKSQKLQIEIVIGDKPENLNDTSFIQNLENVGFKKKEISSDKHQEIKEVFREKSHKNSFAAACIAVYRDILIFKEKEEIKGIAKIWFDCGKNKILGTNANTMEFGQSGDYSKLAKILNE